MLLEVNIPKMIKETELRTQLDELAKKLDVEIFLNQADSSQI